MFFIIGLIKCLLFLAINIGVGLSFCYLFKWFFFLSKPLYLFGKHIPFTPGLLHRKKKWLINKLFQIIKDYLQYAMDEANRHNYLARLEDNLNNQYQEFTSPFLLNTPLPHFIKAKFEKWIQSFGKMLIKKLLRSFVPWVINQADIKGKIELLNEKLDIFMIERYFNEYVFKYILYFTIAFYGLTGLLNIIIFLLVSLF